MATALSATGPTYIFLVMEALVDAGVHLGFSRHVAQELVQQMILGSVLFAMESHKHPAELRNMVTSPRRNVPPKRFIRWRKAVCVLCCRKQFGLPFNVPKRLVESGKKTSRISIFEF